MNQPPSIALKQIAVERRATAGDWRIGWRVVNLGEAPLVVHSARLPHGQFKSAAVNFTPALTVAVASAAQFTANVHCQEPPGLVTENGFVILYVTWQNQSWRVFVRVKITVDESGVPASAVESITTQQAGFSGVEN